jgi:hypothetical protein
MHEKKELTHQPSEGGFVFSTPISRPSSAAGPSLFFSDDTGEDRFPCHRNVKSQRTRLDGQSCAHAFQQSFTNRRQQPFGCLQSAQVVLTDRHGGSVRMRDLAWLRRSFVRFKDHMRNPHSEGYRIDSKRTRLYRDTFGENTQHVLEAPLS